MFKLALFLTALLVLFMPAAMLANGQVDADMASAPMSHCEKAAGDEKQGSSEQRFCVASCTAIMSRAFEMDRTVAPPAPAPIARATPFQHGSSGALDPPPPRDM